MKTEQYKELTITLEEEKEHNEWFDVTMDTTSCNVEISYQGKMVACNYFNYNENVIYPSGDACRDYKAETKEVYDRDIANFIAEWKSAYDNRDNDNRIYIIHDEYDTDGGFGDAINQRWQIGSVKGLFNAAWYCVKYTNCVNTEKPYDYLTDGLLSYSAIPNLLNMEVEPFTTKPSERDEDCFDVIWNDDRFIKE